MDAESLVIQEAQKKGGCESHVSENLYLSPERFQKREKPCSIYQISRKDLVEIFWLIKS